MSPNERRPIGALASFGCSATATCTAEAISLPFDTAKVRLMLQRGAGLGKSETPKYSGLLGTIVTMAKEEGPSALWKGLVPGLHRQVVFGGLRLGLYEPVKNLFSSTGCHPLMLKIGSALTTNALAITVASPTDLVKVRLQAQSRGSGPVKYPSALEAYPMIVKEEGVTGLWTGYVPNLMRNSIMGCVELATYDVCKESLLDAGFKDNVPTHFLSGLSSAFMACLVACPTDVVKSRIMADHVGQYSGFLQCATKTLSLEGPRAFYNGFLPYFARAGCFLVSMFMTMEQVKAAYLSLRD